MYRHIHAPEQFVGQYIHHHFAIWEESMPIDRVGYLATAMCSLLMFLIVAMVMLSMMLMLMAIIRSRC